VQGDATVQSGATLTILPGTIVQFASSDGWVSGLDVSRCELIINGILSASGTTANPIVFKAQTGTTSAVWYGIVFNNSAAGSTINHCQVTHAVNGIYLQSGTPPAIANSYIGTCSQYGIYASTTAAASLCGNSLAACTRGINLVNASNVTVLGNTVGACTYGIYLDGTAPYSNIRVEGNRVTGNQTGLYLNNSATNVVVTGNTVTGNAGFGVYIGLNAQPDLGNVGDGSAANDGGNLVQSNSSYDLYNNSALSIKAEGNSWGTQNTTLIDAHIFDYTDNNAKGVVDYLPLLEQMGWTPTCTPTATLTATVTGTHTPTPSATPSATLSASPTGSPSASATATPSATATQTATSTLAITATSTASVSSTTTMTPSSTGTAGSTQTVTPTSTPTATATQTAPASASPTLTGTHTPTRTATSIATPIQNTAVVTPSATPTAVNTLAATSTPVIIHDPADRQTMLAYPNPGSRLIRFACSCTWADRIVIDIYNMSGERVARLSSGATDQALPWDTSGIAPGIYAFRTTLTVDGRETRLPTQKLAIRKP
jgi:parallel beta-helix repeat protein